MSHEESDRDSYIPSEGASESEEGFDFPMMDANPFEGEPPFSSLYASFADFVSPSSRSSASTSGVGSSSTSASNSSSAASSRLAGIIGSTGNASSGSAASSSSSSSSSSSASSSSSSDNRQHVLAMLRSLHEYNNSTSSSSSSASSAAMAAREAARSEIERILLRTDSSALASGTSSASGSGRSGSNSSDRNRFGFLSSLLPSSSSSSARSSRRDSDRETHLGDLDSLGGLIGSPSFLSSVSRSSASGVSGSAAIGSSATGASGDSSSEAARRFDVFGAFGGSSEDDGDHSHDPDHDDHEHHDHDLDVSADEDDEDEEDEMHEDDMMEDEEDEDEEEEDGEGEHDEHDSELNMDFSNPFAFDRSSRSSEVGRALRRLARESDLCWDGSESSESSMEEGGSVRIKKEPVDDSSSSSLDLVSPSLPPIASPAVNPSQPSPAQINAILSQSATVETSLLLSPELFILSIQSQILASVPKMITHIFSIVEANLAGLKKMAERKKGETAKATPGLLAESRATIEKLKQMQVVMETPLFHQQGIGTTSNASTSTSTAASKETVPFSSSSTSAAGANSSSTSSTSLPEITDELSAFRAVLVQSLTTFLSITSKAKLMHANTTKASASADKSNEKEKEKEKEKETHGKEKEKEKDSDSKESDKDKSKDKDKDKEKDKDKDREKSKAEKKAERKKQRLQARAERSSATTSNGSSSSSSEPFPSWFPSDRLAQWQLLICESLYFIESTPALLATTSDLVNHMKKLLAFLGSGINTGSSTSSSSSATRVRDTFLYEKEFDKIAEILQLNRLEGETNLHVDPNNSSQFISTSFTVLDRDQLADIAGRLLSSQPLSYMNRVKLLQGLQKVEKRAKKRCEGFLNFIINKQANTHSHKKTHKSSKDTHADTTATLVVSQLSSISAATTEPNASATSTSSAMHIDTPAPPSASISLSSAASSATVNFTGAATNATNAAATINPSRQSPRAKLIYVLYLLSLHFDIESEELPIVMNLLSIISQFIPQAEPDFVHAAALERAKRLGILSDSRPNRTRVSSAPAPSVSHSSSVDPLQQPLHRSASGNTTLLSMMSSTLPAIDETKDEEKKEMEEKTAEGGADPSQQADVSAEEVSVLERPTLLSPLYEFILDAHPEYLFGFVQRHLLESGSVSMRNHARAFLFQLWRSLPTAQQRRDFFNHIFTIFIDGRSNDAQSTSASSSSHASLSSLAFFGANVREYLTLFNTFIMDSEHVHQHHKLPKNKSANSQHVTMDVDDTSSPTAQSTSPEAETFLLHLPPFAADDKSSPTPVSTSPTSPSTSKKNVRIADFSDCVPALTPADCSHAVRRLLDCLSAQAKSFESHVLTPYYSKLQSLFDLSPTQHYLQTCVCSICNGRGKEATASSSSTSFSDVHYSSLRGSSPMNLVILKETAVETKNTHCSRTHRLHSPQSIHQLQLKVSSVPHHSSSSQLARRSASNENASSVKHLKVLHVFYSNKPGVELAQLPLPASVTLSGSSSSSLPPEGNEHWSLATTTELTSTSEQNVKVNFAIPLTASALCFHFAEYFENFSAVSEGLVCPRCLIPVASRAAPCSRCRETIGQCTRCHTIDYEHPDAFLCRECGLSRYGTFTFLLQSKNSTQIAPIQSEQQRKIVMARIQSIQDKIHTLLTEDMKHVQQKLRSAARDTENRGNCDSSKSSSSSSSSSSKKKSNSLQTRLDYRHLSSSSDVLAAPPGTNAIRDLYQREVQGVHNKLSELYKELSANRAELFMYLHGGNRFFMESRALKSSAIQSSTSADAMTDVDSPSSINSPSIGAPISTTNCYSCSKHFLLLGIAALQELDVDCLCSAHILDQGSHCAKDLSLLVYYLIHSVASSAGPFKLETNFVRNTAGALLVLLMRYNDASEAPGASQWLEQVLESKITRLVQEQSRESDGEFGATEDLKYLLNAMLNPIIILVRADLQEMERSSFKSHRFLNVSGLTSRLKFLFRLLIIALKSQGATSTAVSESVISPILQILVKATSVTESLRKAMELSTAKKASIVAPPSDSTPSGTLSASSNQLPTSIPSSMRRGASSNATSASPASNMARRGPTSFQRSPSIHAQSSPGSGRLGKPGRISTPGSTLHQSIAQATPLPPLSLAGSEVTKIQLTIQALTNELLAELRSAAKDARAYSSVQLFNWLATDDPSSATALFESWMRNRMDEAGAPSCSPSPVPSASPAGSPVPASPEPNFFATLNTLNTTLGLVVDRVFSLPCASAFRIPSSSLSGSSQITDLTSIKSKISAQAYCTEDEFNADISAIVKAAGAPGTAMHQQATELQAAIEKELATDSIRSTLRVLVKEAKPDKSAESDRTAIAKQFVVLKSLHASQWRQMSLAQKFGRRWLNKCKFAHTSTSLSVLNSLHVDSSQLLSSLLFCPTLSVREFAAQLIWNLTYPTHSTRSVNGMPMIKGNKSKGAKSGTAGASSAAPSATAVAAAKPLDAPVDVRLFGFIRVLIDSLRSSAPPSRLFSKQFFALFSHLLHSSPASDPRFKQFAVVRGVIPLVLTHFEEELQSIESEEAQIDFITNIHHISSLADSSISNSSDGAHKHHSLYGLSVLLSCALSDAAILSHFKSIRSGQGLTFGAQVMSFFLRIRGLMLVHSKYLDMCSSNLKRIIKKVFSGQGEDNKRSTLLAYVYALSSARKTKESAGTSMLTLQRNQSSGDVLLPTASTPLAPLLNPHITIYILEQLCDLIKPQQLEKQCLVTFRKAATQEEFIQGRMKNTPYKSSDFLPANASAGAKPEILFRNVKEAICHQLKIDNEENILELLVDGKIVSLDVPLMKMYKKWYAKASEGEMGPNPTLTGFIQPNGQIQVMLGNRDDQDDESDSDSEDGDSSSGAAVAAAAAGSKVPSKILLAGHMAMQITYRLTGLDGEATEEKIDSIADDEEEKKELDPEKEFELAGALNESGLRALTYRLYQSMHSDAALKEDVELRLASLLVKLLQYGSHIKVNRNVLLELQPPTELSHRQSAVPFVFRVIVEKIILGLRNANSVASLKRTTSSIAASPNAAAAPTTLLDLSLDLISLLTRLLHAFIESSASSLPKIQSIDQSPEWSVPNQQLQSFLTCLSLPIVRSNSALTQQLVALIPLLSFGQKPLLATIESYFAPHLDFDAFDAFHTTDHTYWIETFAMLASHIPQGVVTKTSPSPAQGSSTSSSSTPATSRLTPSPIGSAIRDYFLESGLVKRLFVYLQQSSTPATATATVPSESKVDASGDVNMESATSTVPAPPAKASRKRAREEHDVLALKDKASLPYILRILTGLVFGHHRSQSLASTLSITKTLQSLEGMASTTRVGPLAESLLQALMLDNTTVSEQIDEMRGNKREEKKRKALDQRAKMLAKMGVKTADGGKVSAPKLEFSGIDLSMIEETQHVLKCSVCQEGYMPSSGNLGFYVFNSRISIITPTNDGMSDESADESTGISTVTHFNVIHVKCHEDAFRADQKLKPKKAEWEGATIRNQHTLCNNLFPIMAPPPSVLTGQPASVALSTRANSNSTPASVASTSALLNPSSPLWDSVDIDTSFEHYKNSFDTYWSHLISNYHFSRERLEVQIEDFRALLSRFATLRSFSDQSKGGGKESNMRFIPYLIQMTSFMLFQNSSSTKDRIEGHMQTAYETLTGNTLSAVSVGSSRSTRTSSQLSLNSMGFLDSLVGTSFLSGASSSAAPASSGSASVSSSKAPSLSSTLARSSALFDLVPYSYKVDSAISKSIYSNALDYFEYIMVLSLVLLSAAQWDEMKFPLLWRMLRQAKETIKTEVTERKNSTSTSPTAAVSTAAPGVASSEEKKESEEKSGEDADMEDFIRTTQLEVLRPIFLFWSLVDSLHHLFGTPAGSPFHASQSAALVSSTTSAWLRRWGQRRSVFMPTQLSNFRSVMRREQEILEHLSKDVLHAYEVQSSSKDIQAIARASPGLIDGLTKEGTSIDELLTQLL